MKLLTSCVPACLVLGLAQPSLRAQCPEATLQPAPGPWTADFGSSIAFTGSTLAVGNRLASTGGSTAGAVFVYELGSSGWTLSQELVAADYFTGMAFGRSLAMHGDTLLAGSSGGSGGLYVFERSAGRWSQVQKLVPLPALGDFASELALDAEGDDVFVAEPGDEALSTQEAVHHYHRGPTGWSLEAKLDPNFSPSYGNPYFSMSVDIDGPTLFVGNAKDSPAGPSHPSPGAVFVFEQQGGIWMKLQELRVQPLGSVLGLGNAVDAQGDVLAVGARTHAAVAVFEKSAGAWSQTALLEPPGGTTSLAFGWSVLLHGGHLFVGAPNGVVPGPGKVFVYQRTDADWRLVSSFGSPSPAGDDAYGQALRSAAHQLVVGAPRDLNSPAAGGVWVHSLSTGPASIFCQTAPNSAGAGALIGALGSTSIGNNDFELTASAAPPGVLAKFYYGPVQQQIPFGNGFGCIGGGGVGIFRLLPAQATSAQGTLSRLVDFSAPPAGSGPGQILPGSTWCFQLWYRDPAAGGASFNFSDGLSASFCP